MEQDLIPKALDFLARREHSRAELRAKLLARGFTAFQVDEALEKLIAKDLQSDDRFADLFVASRIERGYGPLKIAAELRARGINDSAVATNLTETEWVHLAQQVRQRRFGEKIPASFQQQVPQMRFLTQRGFTKHQARAACGSLSVDYDD